MAWEWKQRLLHFAAGESFDRGEAPTKRSNCKLRQAMQRSLATLMRLANYE